MGDDPGGVVVNGEEGIRVSLAEIYLSRDADAGVPGGVLNQGLLGEGHGPPGGGGEGIDLGLGHRVGDVSGAVEGGFGAIGFAEDPERVGNTLADVGVVNSVGSAGEATVGGAPVLLIGG